MILTLLKVSIVLTIGGLASLRNVSRIEISPYMRIYLHGSRITTEDMNLMFKAGVTQVRMTLKKFYYVDYINITTEDRKFPLTVALWRLSGHKTICNETSPALYQCKHICNIIQVSDIRTTLLTFEVYGHDTKYNKYVGCFDAGDFMDLERFDDLDNCENACNGATFYGYSEEEDCFCISSLTDLPIVDLELCNKQCLEKPFTFCGGEYYVSVYSMREITKANLSAAGKCPLGRVGLTCEAIDCSVKNGNCGLKVCRELELGLPTRIGICSCENDHYLDNELSCQDVDECKTNDICPLYGGKCINLEGSYTCECGNGFINVDEKNCQDVDECDEHADCDSMTTTCKNVFGGFECLCKEGYTRSDQSLISCSALTGDANDVGEDIFGLLSLSFIPALCHFNSF